MKKLFVILVVFLVCVSSVFAVSSVNVDKAIEEKALELKGVTVNKTVAKIDTYVEDTVKYKFYYYGNGLSYTWTMKEGDCTDKAVLKCAMLKYDKIDCRLVHGYVKTSEDSRKVKHDWIEWKDGKNWVSDECKYWDYCRKTGSGIW